MASTSENKVRFKYGRGSDYLHAQNLGLRPILANTYLDRFDKLMERYGNRIGGAFVIHSKDLRADGDIVYVPIYMMPFIKWK